MTSTHKRTSTTTQTQCADALGYKCLSQICIILISTTALILSIRYSLLCIGHSTGEQNDTSMLVNDEEKEGMIGNEMFDDGLQHSIQAHTLRSHCSSCLWSFFIHLHHCLRTKHRNNFKTAKQMNVLWTAYRGLFTRPLNKTTWARWSMMKKRKGWSAMKYLMSSTTAHWGTHSTAVAAAASDPSSFTSTTAFTQSTGGILTLPNRCPCWDDDHLIMCKTTQVSNWMSCELLRTVKLHHK